MNLPEADSIFTEPLYQVKSKVAVVLTKEWESVEEPEKALLNKILGALKMNPHSVRVISTNEMPLEKSTAGQDRLIIFGPLDSLPLYEPVLYKSINTVVSEDLTALLGNENARKQLWAALRKLFGV